MVDRLVSFTHAGALLVFGTFALAGCGVEHANVSFDVNAQGTGLAFSSADGDLYLLQLSSRSIERLTQTNVEESTPAFSPDGRRVAYSADEADGSKSLFEYSLTSKTTRRLTSQGGVRDLAPRYAPDGSRIVFTRAHRLRPYSMGGQTWDDWDLYVIDRDAHPRRLTFQNSRSPNEACFIDAGQKVLFSGDGQGDRIDPQLYELGVDAAAQTPRPVEAVAASAERRGGAWATDLNVSHNQALTTFVSDREEPFQYDVYVMPWEGKTPLPLHVTTVAHYNQNPRFAADDKSVWFLAGTEQNRGSRPVFSLWRVNIADRKLEQVADSALFTNPARWRPRH
jgi:Tol biopolymer transport system component